MKLDFLKKFSQRILLFLVCSAVASGSAVYLCSFLVKRLEKKLVLGGYRSSLVGPGGFQERTRLLFLFLIAVLVFLAVFFGMLRGTLRYLDEIMTKVREISAGDFDHPVEVHGTDEFSVIAADLNVMQKNIKQIMEREKIAENTKNDLVSSVAHDLRTPLTSIIGYLGWVRDKKELDEATKNHYIDIAYQKALRLEQLTNELFGFVKLEHSELRLSMGCLDLVQLMEQMLDEMTPGFVQNEIQVSFSHKEDSIPIEADGELLARLFGNLLNNAIKYGKEGKQILVKMEEKGEYVSTKVVNFGRVIPKQELDHIFEKFYRTEQSRSRDTGGTGLGLAIVHQIAELHHGEVHVKSDLQGTVFEVELPIHQFKKEG